MSPDLALVRNTKERSREAASICHMRIHLRHLPLIVLAATLPILAACERELTGAEADRVVGLADPTIDGLFAGLVAGDYGAFTSNFDDFMRRSVPDTCFPDFRDDLHNNLGAYQSREVHRVAQVDEFYVVEYLASFERRDSVIVGIAFHRRDPYSVDHLWIESGQLSWVPEPRRQCK
jgi:hypothetical protein